MAYVLQLVGAGGTDDLLDGTNYKLEDGGLKIGRPSKKETWVGSGSFMQGRVLSGVTYDNRKIEVIFEIIGTDRSAILNKKTDLARTLESARQHQLTGITQAAELRVQIDDAADMVYFDVVDGEIELPDDYMSVEKQHWGGGTTLKGVRMILTCKPFARGAQNTLVNGVTIENTYDTYNDNYVSWNGSAVDGDVPGPLEITIEPNAQSFSAAWYGLRDSGTLSNYWTMLEAEDASLYQSGSISGTNSAYSGDTTGAGGYTVNWTLSGTTSNTIIAKWDDYSTYYNYEDNAGKHRVLAIGKWRDDCRYQLQFASDDTGVTIREYPKVRPSSACTVNPCVLDMGVVEKIPFNVPYGERPARYDIEFYVQPDDTGSKPVELDALIFIPANDYKYRSWITEDDAAASTTRDVIDNAEDGRALIYMSANDVYESVINANGLPIHATPGEGGRLYFTFLRILNHWVASDTFDITVKHTPYYLDVRGLF